MHWLVCFSLFAVLEFVGLFLLNFIYFEHLHDSKVKTMLKDTYSREVLVPFSFLSLLISYKYTVIHNSLSK